MQTDLQQSCAWEDKMFLQAYISPVHLDLENDLILSLQIFFKNAEKITSGGLIMSLENLGLILYFNFLQKIFM